MSPDRAREAVRVLRQGMLLHSVEDEEGITLRGLVTMRSQVKKEHPRLWRLYKLHKWLRNADTHERLCREVEHLLTQIDRPVTAESGAPMTEEMQAVAVMIKLAAEYGEKMFRVRGASVYYQLTDEWAHKGVEQNELIDRLQQEN